MSKNTKKYWFNRKRYGYGWGLPATWQGWVSFGVYLTLLVLGAGIVLQDVPDNTFTKEVGFFLVFVLVLTLTYILLMKNHAPKMKWRWGKSDDK